MVKTKWQFFYGKFKTVRDKSLVSEICTLYLLCYLVGAQHSVQEPFDTRLSRQGDLAQYRTG